MESLAGRIIGVVGWKDSGKTSVVEALVEYLSGKGLAVGTVKHVHEDVSLEPEAKDSKRHLDAGASATVVLGQDGAVVISRGADLDQAAARYLSLCDCIIVEGFKHKNIPKIVIVSGSEDILKEVENVIAVIYRDRKPEDYPAFSPDEIPDLADFLLEKGILKQAGRRISLLVNGKPVRMNEFVQSSLSSVILGFISSLRNVEEPSTVELAIDIPGTRE
jgi:molybdopterin-guanine dinucleotide biosynthesis protein B